MKNYKQFTWLLTISILVFCIIYNHQLKKSEKVDIHKLSGTWYLDVQGDNSDELQQQKIILKVHNNQLYGSIADNKILETEIDDDMISFKTQSDENSEEICQWHSKFKNGKLVGTIEYHKNTISWVAKRLQNT